MLNLENKAFTPPGTKTKKQYSNLCSFRAMNASCKQRVDVSPRNFPPINFVNWLRLGQSHPNSLNGHLIKIYRPDPALILIRFFHCNFSSTARLFYPLVIFV